jgi:gliding motility-associated-like protein
MSITDTSFCRGSYATFTGDYTMIGNTGITWDFGNGDSILNVNPVMYAYPAAGTYVVTATAKYRVCQSEQVSRTVTVFPTPNIDLGPDTTICEGSSGMYFMDHINNGNASAHWHWNTGDNGPGIQVSHYGHYHCTVTVDGCSASDSVNVENDCYVSTPNVFTPNGDGINDYFYPRSLLTRGLTAFSMSIYNRWGQEVFHSESVDGRGWDGNLNSTPQPEGVYIYIIDATFKDGVKEHHQGNITLIR